MRRGSLAVFSVAILLLLASIPAAGLGRSPAHLASTNLKAIASTRLSPSASPTASATPEPTQAVQRNAAAAAAAVAPPTRVIARISIPRIGISKAPIYDRGVDAKAVMLIAPGHDDIQGNIFGHLYDLRPGDTVQIDIGGETQVYRVTGHQIVPPTAVGVMDPTQDVRLTIMTCWPFNVDTKRWIVTAVRS